MRTQSTKYGMDEVRNEAIIFISIISLGVQAPRLIYSEMLFIERRLRMLFTMLGVTELFDEYP